MASSAKLLCMANVAKNIPKKTVGVVFDQDVAEAIEAYARQTREKRNSMIQRVMIEHLTRNGAWPPAPASPVQSKAKTKKAGA